jgi:hypothetical protein
VALAGLLGKDSEELPDDSPEIDPEIDGDGPDPRPRRPEEKEKGKPKPPPARVPPNVRKEVTEKLSAMLEFFAMGLELRDPVCGGALEDQREIITARMVTIICKRPKWMNWFLSGDQYTDWLMLATALQPVAVAMYGHHVTKDATPEQQEEQASYAAPPLPG